MFCELTTVNLLLPTPVVLTDKKAVHTHTHTDRKEVLGKQDLIWVWHRPDRRQVSSMYKFAMLQIGNKGRNHLHQRMVNGWKEGGDKSINHVSAAKSQAYLCSH